MEKYSMLFTLFYFTLLLSALSTASGNIPAVFLFGDSILDAGNNAFNKNCTVQSNFPPYGQDFFHRPTGRFTNGRTVPDFIAQSLGMDLQKPYLEVEMLVKTGKLKNYPANGINFASAGSGVLKDTNGLMGVTPLQVQVDQFANLVNQNKIDKNTIKEALYIFETGSNDIFFYFFPSGEKRPDPDEFVRLMVTEFSSMVQRVYDLGARKMAILGLGPVGCIPARLNLPNTTASQCYAQMNQVVGNFNSGLEDLVHQMPSKLRGAVGVYGATFDVVRLFMTFPVRYGFVDVLSACCGSGDLRGLAQCGTGNYALCKNPQQYVFWDYFHPTEHAYNLIFKAFWYGETSRIRPMNLKTLANLTIPAI